MVEANHGDIAVALPRRWILLFSINRRRVGSQACHSTQRLGVMCLRAFGTGFKIGQSIINFFKELQIEINFNNLDINKEGFKKAIQGLNHDRLKNNPRFLSTKEIIDIYTFNSKY